MQTIYQPSRIPDQRTSYATDGQTLKEMKKSLKDVQIRKSAVAIEVTERIARKRGRPRKEIA